MAFLILGIVVMIAWCVYCIIRYKSMSERDYIAAFVIMCVLGLVTALTAINVI